MRAHARHNKRLVNAAAPAWLCLATGSSATLSCTLLADDFKPDLHSEAAAELDGTVADPSDASAPGPTDSPDCGVPSEKRCVETAGVGPAASAPRNDAALGRTPPPSSAVSPEIEIGHGASPDGGTDVTCKDGREGPDDAGVGCADGCSPCPCVFGNFSEPEPLTGLNVAGDVFGPALSPDGLTLYFAAIVAGVERIYTATRRAAGSAAFAAVREVPAINSGAGEGTPFLSDEGSRLYFYSSRAGSRDLWFSERDAEGGGFSEPVPLAGVNADSTEHLPWLSSDELTLFFSSDRAGGFDIWFATRPSRADDFGTPVARRELNTTSSEGKVSLSADGLTAFLASNRAGGLGLGDIWSASRPDVASRFSGLTNVAEVNSSDAEFDALLSPDGLELFFVSSRTGSVELWHAQRQCSKQLGP